MNSTAALVMTPLSIFSVVISCLTILLNVILLSLIVFFKLHRQSNRFFFVADLSLCAIFWSLTVPIRESLMQTNPDVYNRHSGLLCKLLSVLNFGGLQIEFSNLIAIVTDQHVMIASPYKYNQFLSKHRAICISLATFLLPAANCTLIGLSWDSSKSCFSYESVAKWATAIVMTQSIAMLIAPIVVQLLTVRIARKQMRQLQSGPCEVPAETVRRHWSGVITTALLCLMIVLSWVVGTYTILWSMIIGQPEMTKLLKLTEIAAYMNLPHGIWVPLIYAIRSPELKPIYAKFRRSFSVWRSNKTIPLMCHA
jgi:hypothetical protein